LPGVSSSYFGPNASRPIIRGLDGDRIKVLQNGGSTIDASTLSNDHAVAARKPAGGRAHRGGARPGRARLIRRQRHHGGVVNVIDNRTHSQGADRGPSAALSKPAPPPAATSRATPAA
ncbi:TonB-dependent receptor, partial [Cupriavidus basilensis]